MISQEKTLLESTLLTQIRKLGHILDKNIYDDNKQYICISCGLSGLLNNERAVGNIFNVICGSNND